MNKDLKQINNFKRNSGFTLAEVFSVHPKGGRKHGFTLAEVLITLGIIGVVAAMTLPVLIAKHQKKVTVTKLKKLYSELNTVMNVAASENAEDSSNWTYPETTDSPEMENFIKTYFLPYFKGATFYSRDEFTRNIRSTIKNLADKEIEILAPGLILANGQFIQFMVNNPERTGYIWLIADLNGRSLPNKVGRDIFVFNAYSKHVNHQKTKDRVGFYYIYYENYDFLNHDGPEEDTLNNGGYGCSKSNKYGYYAGWFCGQIIYLNKWQIPDDYPW